MGFAFEPMHAPLVYIPSAEQLMVHCFFPPPFLFSLVLSSFWLEGMRCVILKSEFSHLHDSEPRIKMNY